MTKVLILKSFDRLDDLQVKKHLHDYDSIVLVDNGRIEMTHTRHDRKQYQTSAGQAPILCYLFFQTATENWDPRVRSKRYYYHEWLSLIHI